MKTNRPFALMVLLAASASIAIAHPALGQTVNKSNLWYGGDAGIEVVWKTGKNLAYTNWAAPLCLCRLL